MIFYFTGTGNSWYAARRMLHDGEQMINITECMQNRKHEFEVPEGEPLGFVFPVYYGGLPSIVRSFIKRLKLSGPETYTYAVITCGASIGDAGGMLKAMLGKANVALDAVLGLRMPDNYAKMYEPASEEEVPGILAKADKELEKIRAMADAGQAGQVGGSAAGKLMTQVLYPMYRYGRKTKPFYADDRCVGCGVCASRCPVRAIEMKDGRPRWVKERCVDCMACCRCNAIQYGKKMLNHSRYVNPEFKKLSKCLSH